jgi:hypothetical protein
MVEIVELSGKTTSTGESLRLPAEFLVSVKDTKEGLEVLNILKTLLRDVSVHSHMKSYRVGYALLARHTSGHWSINWVDPIELPISTAKLSVESIRDITIGVSQSDLGVIVATGKEDPVCIGLGGSDAMCDTCQWRRAKTGVNQPKELDPGDCFIPLPTPMSTKPVHWCQYKETKSTAILETT